MVKTLDDVFSQKKNVWKKDIAVNIAVLFESLLRKPTNNTELKLFQKLKERRSKVISGNAWLDDNTELSVDTVDYIIKHLAKDGLSVSNQGLAAIMNCSVNAIKVYADYLENVGLGRQITKVQKHLTYSGQKGRKRNVFSLIEEESIYFEFIEDVIKDVKKYAEKSKSVFHISNDKETSKLEQVRYEIFRPLLAWFGKVPVVIGKLHHADKGVYKLCHPNAETGMQDKDSYLFLYEGNICFGSTGLDGHYNIIGQHKGEILSEFSKDLHSSEFDEATSFGRDFGIDLTLALRRKKSDFDFNKKSEISKFLSRTCAFFFEKNYTKFTVTHDGHDIEFPDKGNHHTILLYDSNYAGYGTEAPKSDKAFKTAKEIMQSS